MFYPLKKNSTAAFLLPCLAFALLGCQTVTVPVEGLKPKPEVKEAPASVPVRTAESRDLAGYYKSVENGLVAQGLLRRDGGGPDVPFNSRNLVENFVRIALFEEYTASGGRIVARETASRIHRWDQPVQFKVTFGDTVPADQRAKDSRNIGSYVARLSRLTNRPMRLVSEAPNFHVFVVNESERRALGPELRRILPGISNAVVNAVTDMPRSTFCLVFASDPGDSGRYDKAVAVIRGEHPDLLRLSCIHEELAQGLGLANDSPAARPSIFNDDEEFGLLTNHDEMLLKMLYDPRIRAGMDAGKARAVAEQIAAELLGERPMLN